MKLRKPLIVLLLICLLSAVAAFLFTACKKNTEAEDGTSSKGLSYAISSDSTYCSIWSIGTCADTDIVIASEYKGLPVKKISEDAFRGNNKIKTVSIPDSVTAIEDYAFYNCINLKSVTIGSGVRKIGENAFGKCNLLEKIDVDMNNIKYASQNGVLFNKERTQIIEVPPIVSGAITIPDGVTNIAYSFSKCHYITSITIGKGVTTIADNAFEECNMLEKIVVNSNNSYYSSQDGILYDKGQTHIVTVPQALKGSVTIPGSVSSIDDYALHLRKDVTAITIEKGVRKIGKNAFSNTKCEEIHIPDSVKEIGEDAFSNTHYEKVYIPDIKIWCNISFTDKNSNPLNSADTLYVKNELVTDLIIPDGVNYIGNYAFSGCNGIESVTIADSVTSIGNSAFENCYNLKSVKTGDGVRSIKKHSFDGCTNLQSIEMGNGVKSIGQYVFFGCKRLISVVFKNKTNWQAYEFLENKTTVFAEKEIGTPIFAAELLVQKFCHAEWSRAT